MTRERAIEVLKAWDLNWSDEFTANEFEQAFAMAISALSENKGEWKRVSIDRYTEHAMYRYKCSECGELTLGEKNFCPNCGCRMKGGE